MLPDDCESMKLEVAANKPWLSLLFCILCYKCSPLAPPPPHTHVRMHLPKTRTRTPTHTCTRAHARAHKHTHTHTHTHRNTIAHRSYIGRQHTALSYFAAGPWGKLVMHSPSQHCTQCKNKNGMAKSIIIVFLPHEMLKVSANAHVA